jgi:hypothetical protein
MKKSEWKALGIVALICAALCALWYQGCNAEGIVALEGYEHGVAFCEEEYPIIIFDTEEAHLKHEDGIFYVINKGHLDDPEVKQLVDLAEAECAQYLED